ncbi:MAG: prepilin-type N-terminal cleavage/methylation domain-containing protein [Pseudomonadota bacterium]|nr:prepilin-type N-terminal cleavage/methylation domain-containing protein [Pseudomonadota bacterium]
MRISASSLLPGPASRRAGYTMMEVVVVVAILATALSLSTPALIGMVEQQRVRTVLHDVNTHLTDLRATSQIEAREIDAAEAEATLARDLPLGWYVAVGEDVTFSAAGTCTGGRLQLTTPQDRQYVFELARRTCMIEPRAAQ